MHSLITSLMMRKNNILRIGTVAALLLLPTLIFGAGDTHVVPDKMPIVTIVKVPAPWYAPRFAIVSKMIDSIPQYLRVPGLLFKAYSIERISGDYGGVYYWSDSTQANDWFSISWFERVRKERGADGQVLMFDAPVSIDNVPGGTSADNSSDSVTTLVEISIPSDVNVQQLVAQFKNSVPYYQKVPGLLRKYFIITEQGTFGGVYLWKDDVSAQSFFNEEWHRQVIRQYGKDAQITWFDTPILLPTGNATGVISHDKALKALP